MNLPKELTLRDYFASQALVGLLDRCGVQAPTYTTYPIKQFAEMSYKYADEMLKEKERIEKT
jgi:hypothetical protein